MTRIALIEPEWKSVDIPENWRVARLNIRGIGVILGD